ncbi:hypothetical protein SPRG_13416 [Saprolegnia parasitica CBS 223.65]|uniref:C3H1-type domain-containing protein n=1 Tax=Saprolegnia parasitica (strain CBS 223.65) TaxID=695850 RepID=A0A067BQB0_SAPPC|nr:hypothetical protein SPRG_13416 [Saprolegnia parasitica CBS 223.65]KDO20664.1 hypothetical protein SPRG_13416 [Saprolegnia parasitica CBS 223.65]|eukprot:XP_012208629.1 hypothetical protein SPRG_13416 [Saprolegnia parasitica CBS 223.65]
MNSRDAGYGGPSTRDAGYGGPSPRDAGYSAPGSRDAGYGGRDAGYGGPNAQRDAGYGAPSGPRDAGYSGRDQGYGRRDEGYGQPDLRDNPRDASGYGSGYTGLNQPPPPRQSSVNQAPRPQYTKPTQPPAYAPNVAPSPPQFPGGQPPRHHMHAPPHYANAPPHHHAGPHHHHGGHAPPPHHRAGAAPGPYYPPPPPHMAHHGPPHMPPPPHFDPSYHMHGPPRGPHPPPPNAPMMYHHQMPPHHHPHGPPGMYPPLPPANGMYPPGYAPPGPGPSIPPMSYVCRKCNMGGHWIHDCMKKSGPSNAAPRTAKPALPTAPGDMPFHCEPCEKHFALASQHEAHMNTHESCWAPDCDFSACKRVVTAHYQTSHGQFAGSGLKEIEVEGQKFNVLVGNSPEEIAKWREERRKKWPSDAVVKRKLEDNEERVQAGDVVAPAAKRAKPATEKAKSTDSPNNGTKKSSKFCVKYIRNVCDLGDKCAFNHDISGVSCKTFATKGFCRRGDECKFLHAEGGAKPKPVPAKAPKTAATQVKEHKSSLLSKLLEKDVEKEQRLMLQAFRYIVEHNFFAPSSA